jgi:hypothetical protein
LDLEQCGLEIQTESLGVGKSLSGETLPGGFKTPPAAVFAKVGCGLKEAEET